LGESVCPSASLRTAAEGVSLEDEMNWFILFTAFVFSSIYVLFDAFIRTA